MHGAALPRPARVVVRAVEPAEDVYTVLDQRRDLALLRDVAAPRARLAPRRGDLLRDRLAAGGVDVGDQNLRAFARERERAGAPDAGRRARDERNLAGNEPRASHSATVAVPTTGDSCASFWIVRSISTVLSASFLSVTTPVARGFESTSTGARNTVSMRRMCAPGAQR